MDQKMKGKFLFAEKIFTNLCLVMIESLEYENRSSWRIVLLHKTFSKNQVMFLL